MLVQGSATEEERASEAREGIRTAQTRGEINGIGGAGVGGSSGGADGWFSRGRTAYDSDSGVGDRGSHHLDLRPALSGIHQGVVRGRRLGWHAGSGSVEEDGEEDDEEEEEESARHDGAGRGHREVWTEQRGASSIQTEDDDDDEDEDETEEAEADGSGTSDSVSGPDAESDSTASMGATVCTPGGVGSCTVRGERDEESAGLPSPSPCSSDKPASASASSSPGSEASCVPREELPPQEKQQQQQKLPPQLQELPREAVGSVDECWDVQRQPSADDASRCGPVR